MSETLILTLFVAAATLQAAVFVPLAAQRLPANYRKRPGRPASVETTGARNMRGLAGALLLLAAFGLGGSRPFAGFFALFAGLVLTSFPGKHSLIRWSLQFDVVRDLVDSLREAGDVGPLEFGASLSSVDSVGLPKLQDDSPQRQLDLKEQLAKKLLAASETEGTQPPALEPQPPRPLIGTAEEELELPVQRAPIEIEEEGEDESEDGHESEPEDDEMFAEVPVGYELRAREPVDPLAISQALLNPQYPRAPHAAENPFVFTPRRSGLHVDNIPSAPTRGASHSQDRTLGLQNVEGVPLFGAYLAVDWSAQARPGTGKNTIWWCAVERAKSGKVTHRMSNPSSRVKALQEIGELFSDWYARGVSVCAGFDFAFGFPRGFGSAIGTRAPRWRGNWELIAGRIRDEQVGKKKNNRFDVASSLNSELPGDGPFWGHPAKESYTHLGPKKPKEFAFPERRYCEELVPKAQSVWKTAYAGSVGGQTLMGIPYVQHLSTVVELEDAVSVWPFDPGSTESVVSIRPRIILAEVYPSLIKPHDDPDKPLDANQVHALAHYFETLDRDGQLAELLAAPDKLPEELREVVVGEEGWILGVPAPEPEFWDK
ncbi:MAG: hypothetical protein ACJAYU_004917 [Bradymonadia bacterium]|jgi:hypothetical protein